MLKPISSQVASKATRYEAFCAFQACYLKIYGEAGRKIVVLTNNSVMMSASDAPIIQWSLNSVG